MLPFYLTEDRGKRVPQNIGSFPILQDVDIFCVEIGGTSIMCFIKAGSKNYMGYEPREQNEISLSKTTTFHSTSTAVK
jgi:hypothetical protein